MVQKANRVPAGALIPLAFFLSGATALVYESMWMRQFGLIFGNTTYSVSVILATFMGGMALGSFLITRLQFRKMLRVYAAVEAGVGVTALLTTVLLKRLPLWYGLFVQTHPVSPQLELLIRVLAAALIIGPTTVLLGTTFPLLAEHLTRAGGRMYASIGALYRLNTLGAVCGVLLTTFVLLPNLGVIRVFWAAAATNLLIGLAVGLTSLRSPQPSAASSAAEASRPAAVPAFRRLWPFAALAFVSGLSSFGLEILWTRSMSLVIGSSFYSFNSMLAAFLLGIVLGALLYERLWPMVPAPALLLGALFLGLGLLVLLDVALIGRLPRVYYNIMVKAGSSFLNFQAIGFALCLLSMVVVTMVFGFTFPLLPQLAEGKALPAQRISGLLYAWNTLGSILGALAAGFLLVPLAGIQASYVWLAGLLAVSGMLVLLAQLKAAPAVMAAAPLGLTVALVLAGIYYKPWDPLLMTAGVYKYGLQWRSVIPDGRALQESLHAYRSLQFYEEGLEGVVSVTKSGANTFLAINGKIDAGTHADIITQKLLAHVPLTLHADPQTVFVVGWGSGSTVGSALLHPVRAIDCAEIEPEVFRTASYFSEVNFGAQGDSRLRLIFQDARNVLLTGNRTYDVIISEPSNPWVSGMSSLFTSDFYAIALRRLNDDGLFCQWFHYYDLTLADIRVQIRTFCRYFPYVSLWLVPPLVDKKGGRATPIGDILLVGCRHPVRLDYRRVSRAFATPAIRADLSSVSVAEELSFLCNYVADRDDLQLLAGAAPLNTDDSPYIELSAPKGLYAASSHAVQDQFSIYNTLVDAGRLPAPPLVNYPPLAEDARSSEKAAAFNQLASVCRQKLQLNRARRLEEAAAKLIAPAR